MGEKCGVKKMPGDVVDYCDECGKPLGSDESYYKNGLHFCIVCRDIVGAQMGI